MKHILATIVLSFPVSIYASNPCSINEPWKFRDKKSFPAKVDAKACEIEKKEITPLLPDNESLSIKHSVDLNNDGECEIFAIAKRYGSTAGAYYYIFQKVDNAYKSIGNYRAWNVNLLEIENGYYQIYSSDVSGKNFVERAFSFDGSKYIMSKSMTYMCNESTGRWEFESDRKP